MIQAIAMGFASLLLCSRPVLVLSIKLKAVFLTPHMGSFSTSEEKHEIHKASLVKIETHESTNSCFKLVPISDAAIDCLSYPLKNASELLSVW